MNSRAQIGTILKEHGVISEQQLEAALQYQTGRGCGLGEALRALDLCTDVDLCRALAEQNDLPFIDLHQTPPNAQALRLIPREIAVEYGVIPVRVEGKRLLVAARNPFDFRIDEVIRSATRMTAVVACVAESQLNELLGKYEQLKYQSNLSASTLNTGTYRPGARFGGGAPVGLDLIPPSEQTSTVRKVNSLIADTVRRRARDIFVEPSGDVLRVRVRIDGVVHPMTTIPRFEAAAVLARFLATCGVAPGAKPGMAPPGSCEVRVEGKTVRFSATVSEGADGAILALRNQSLDGGDLPLDQLGMEPETLTAVRRILARRQGMLIVSGPVGAGCPTTMYAMAAQLQAKGLHTLALEHSFERRLTGISRIQTDHGVQSFTAMLTAGLSQRPDAFLAGDLPDKDAAEIACRAAATGQFVLAGAPAPDAPTALSRLLDMGVSPALLASGVRGILAQRLVRRVCEQCSREARLGFQLQQALQSHYTLPRDVLFRKGRGCKACHRTGTRGQIGVFELMEFDEDLQSLIAQRALPSVFRKALADRGFRTLEEDGFRKACRGVIPQDEIVRLGGSVALSYEEIMVRSAPPAHELSQEDAAVLPAAPETEAEEMVTWDQVAEMARLLEE